MSATLTPKDFATEQEVRTLRGIVATLSYRKRSGRNGAD